MTVKFVSPPTKHYDVVIVGGAIYGSAVAWFLSRDPDFDGSILVVERDPGYTLCSTAHTNSCMRQQFTQEINIRVSQFAAEYVRDFRGQMEGDERIPDLHRQYFGYLYLANDERTAAILRENQQRQALCGAGTRHMTPRQIALEYPFYRLDDIVAGNHNPIDEGYFDCNTMFQWWRRKARENGVLFLANEVVGMTLSRARNRVTHIRLLTGESVSCTTVVNASGPRAALTAQMAGIAIPVEPRKRYTFVFAAERPLPRDLPLTIDPTGIHMRSDGSNYMAGCPPDDDPAVAPDDFTADHKLWEEKVWPAIAHRVPQFEAVRLLNSWVGHYAFNTFDHNAIVGPHSDVGNFVFVNGFSGHGVQQSPAVGRGVAEWIVHGEYRSLDLRAFHHDRIVRGEPLIEKAVI